MNSKTNSIAPVLRGDENGVHRAAVQLKPGDVWYDINAPSIYILLSTAPWTFLVSGVSGTAEVWVPGGPGTESHIRYLFEHCEKIA